MLRAFVTAVAIGVVTELAARRGRLWVYRRPLYPVLNVLVVFGAVMGAIATLGARLGVVAVFGIGVAIGLAWELANVAVLDWWFFPGDRLGVVRGRTACALAIAITWGLVPVMVFALTRP